VLGVQAHLRGVSDGGAAAAHASKTERRWDVPRRDATDVSLSVHAAIDLDAELERHAARIQQPPASAPVIPLEGRFGPGAGSGVRTSGATGWDGRRYYDRSWRVRVCAQLSAVWLLNVSSWIVYSQTFTYRPMDLILTENRLVRVRKA